MLARPLLVAGEVMGDPGDRGGDGDGLGLADRIADLDRPARP